VNDEEKDDEEEDKEEEDDEEEDEEDYSRRNEKDEEIEDDEEEDDEGEDDEKENNEEEDDEEKDDEEEDDEKEDDEEEDDEEDKKKRKWIGLEAFHPLLSLFEGHLIDVDFFAIDLSVSSLLLLGPFLNLSSSVLLHKIHNPIFKSWDHGNVLSSSPYIICFGDDETYST